jgi:protein phosphatase
VQEIPLTTGGSEWLAVSSLSDVGCVRDNNEDSIGVFPHDDPAKGTLLIVADGMGGAAAGEVASRLAVERVREGYFRSDERSPAIALRTALESANASILEKARTDRRLAGMGTTCTAVAVIGRELWFAHIGDSRAYLKAGVSLRQLTSDHSLAAELGRQGGAEDLRSRARNVLTRCLGVRAEVQIDVSEAPTPLPDDAGLIICSDGLCNLVNDGEIHQIVSMHGPDGACRRLVQLAKERGAPDNVSVAVGRITRD